MLVKRALKKILSSRQYPRILKAASGIAIRNKSPFSNGVFLINNFVICPIYCKRKRKIC